MSWMLRSLFTIGFVLLLSASVVTAQDASSEQGEEEPFAPNQENLPVAPPEDAIVLFGGKDVNLFLDKEGKKVDWPVEDGELISSRTDRLQNHIVSRLHFRDAEIHAEFKLPEKGSGNSGIYIHGNYELQVINSFGKENPNAGDAGAIYGFFKPLVNACKKPGEWQVYDIRYRAPRRDGDGKIIENGRITAWLNGQKVQDKAEFGEPRSTYHPYRFITTQYLKDIWARQKATMVGPVFLQDHNAPTRFRNVWVRALDDLSFMYPAAEEEEPEEDEKKCDKEEGEKEQD